MGFIRAFERVSAVGFGSEPLYLALHGVLTYTTGTSSLDGFLPSAVHNLCQAHINKTPNPTNPEPYVVNLP